MTPFFIQVTYHDGSTESYTYYANGQRKTATDSNGTTTYTYDDRDRLATETKPDGTVLTYDYDEAGNRTLLQTDIPNTQTNSTDTTTTTYSYDNLNRLETVTDHHNQVTTYTYDDVGNRESVTYPNGTSTTYVYDALNRLETLQTVNSSNQIISQFDYTLYPTGHRASMTDLAGTVTSYQYDELYRLTQETINHVTLGTVINSYTYDPVGNRETATENGQTTTYTYDANDRMLTSTQNGVTTTYTYDDNGNTVSKVTNGDETTFGYDPRNKLIEAVQYQASTPVSNVYFDYDIDGNRTQKIDNGTVIHFVVDRNQAYAQVVHETNDQNATLVTYTHGDDLISQDRNATINYYNYDGLGSTRSLTDFLGQITDTYDYNAYGTILDQSGSTQNNFLYTGEQFDASLDNYYLRARYYDPANGRFTQMDTYQGRMNEPVTLHKYLYANGDPANFFDPSGHMSLAEQSEVSNGQLALEGAMLKSSEAFINLVGILYVLSSSEDLSPNRASSALALGASLYKIRQCQRSGSTRCKAGIPIIYYGSDVMDVTLNIATAMLENNSPVVLQRKSPVNPRSWMYSPAVTKGECIGKTGGATGKECDEYPFASSYQGGQWNYTHDGSVRITPVSKSHNKRAGAKLEGFGGLYRKCDVRANDPIMGWYGVLPVPNSQTRVQCVGD